MQGFSRCYLKTFADIRHTLQSHIFKIQVHEFNKSLCQRYIRARPSGQAGIRGIKKLIWQLLSKPYIPIKSDCYIPTSATHPLSPDCIVFVLNNPAARLSDCTFYRYAWHRYQYAVIK